MIYTDWRDNMIKQIRELSFADVIAAIQKSRIGGKFMFRANTVSYYIKCTTTMKVIAQNPKCAICGAKATHAILCKDEENDTYFISFYTERNGKLVLFTKDHIVPRANGGSDKITNLQSCCEVCNRYKSDLTENNEEALEIIRLKNQIQTLKGELASQQNANLNHCRRNEKYYRKLTWFRQFWLFRLLEKYYMKHEKEWLL